MKQKILQWGVITSSAVLTIAVGLFVFQSIEQLGKTSVLDAESNENTGSFSYESRISKGDELFAYGYYQEAAIEYAYAANLEPTQADIFAKLSRTYTALNQFEKAKENAAIAYELSPSSTVTALYAKTLLRVLDIETTKNILENNTEVDQSISYAKALLYLVQEDHENAFKEFESALALSGPESPAELQNFVDAYTQFSQTQGGSTAYRNALLCKALIDAKEWVLAQELALKTLSQQNDYRDVWMLLGYAQLELGDAVSAEDSFRTAKKIDSTKPEIHYFLGSALFLQNKYEETIDEMELALLYGFEATSEAYKKVAQSQEALGRPEEALAAYEAMLNVSAHSINDYVDPIRTAIDQVKDLDRALTLAEKAVTSFPSEALSHSLLAEVYLAQGNLPLAENSIQTAFDINPNLAEAHLNAGKIREAEGNTDGAAWEYKKAFELSTPGSPLNQSAATLYNQLTPPPVNP